MKCKHCNGDGFIIEVNHGYADKYMCDHCLGTGIIEPMTNEEYLKSCNTEQLADIIADFYLLGFTHGHNQMDITSRTKWAEWLKQPYSPK